MDAKRRHEGGACCFPLTELASRLPGVLQNHLLPALHGRHQAALAASCRLLRGLVHSRVETLRLAPGVCCQVQVTPVAADLPNLRHLVLQPSNLHEAMSVLPLFLLKDVAVLSGITSICLQDGLPDKPPVEVKCEGCPAWTSTYDLSAILATIATTAPRLAALEFSTHYISDAECAAIGRMTGLTRLVLSSPYGTKLGGLGRLAGLSRIASLSLLSDSLRADARDIAWLLGRQHLSSVVLGYNPALAAPLLAALAEMSQEQQEAPGVAGSRDAAEAGRLPRPPALSRLVLVLSPYMPRPADVLRSVAALATALVRLELGWLVHESHVPGADSALPQASQRQLSQLAGLTHLALGWPVTYDTLHALAGLTGLQELAVGGLPSPWPPAGPPPGLRLTAVSRLTAHLRLPAPGLPDVPTPAELTWTAGLAAFPSLTQLTLSGCLHGYALRRLPGHAPRLRQLALPQRLSAVRSADLAALRRLGGLTRLRLGWLALRHAGPPSWPEPLVPALPGLMLDDDWLGGGNEQQQEQEQQEQQQQHQQEQQQQEQQQQQGAGDTGQQQQAAPAGNAGPAAAAAPAAPPALPLWVMLPEPPLGPLLTQVNADRNDAGWPRGLSLDALAAQQPRGVPGASSLPPPPPLQALEVVGPLANAELARLSGLHGLTSLVLRDNLAWSSGVSHEPLAMLAARLPRLRHLALHGVPGIDTAALEGRLQAVLPANAWGELVLDVTRNGGCSVERGVGRLHWGVPYSQPPPPEGEVDELGPLADGDDDAAGPLLPPGAMAAPVL